MVGGGKNKWMGGSEKKSGWGGQHFGKSGRGV